MNVSDLHRSFKGGNDFVGGLALLLVGSAVHAAFPAGVRWAGTVLLVVGGLLVVKSLLDACYRSLRESASEVRRGYSEAKNDR